MFISTFTNPTIYDVRRDLVPFPKLPHILYSHLVSSLDNLMMAYIKAETCSCILYIATNSNIVVFMIVCIYRYIHTLQLCNTALTFGEEILLLLGFEPRTDLPVAKTLQ